MPPALVMTLVENAIKHGIEPAADGGRVSTRSAIDQQLVISVADTGVGLTPDSGDAETGTGPRLSTSRNVCRRSTVTQRACAHTKCATAAVLLRFRCR